MYDKKLLHKILKEYTLVEIIKKLFKKIFLNFKIFLINVLNTILGLIDKKINKQNNYWIFPVYFIGKGHFSDSMLAVFNVVKSDEMIKKIILTKDVSVSIEGKNIHIIPMNSLKAIYYLLKSNIIFVQHSLWLDLSKSIFQIKEPLDRKIINLWHGIALKDISHKNTGIYNKRAIKEMLNYRVIASSEQDLFNMQKAFHITPKGNFWLTGLPRNDFLVMQEDNLPSIYKKELIYLKELVKEKKLILYAPTYREKNVGGADYKFSKKELEKLNAFLYKQNAVLGVRYHSYLSPTDYSDLTELSNVIDLSSSIISDVRMIIRESDIIITDYSSLFIDACYIDKKCISFAYDLRHYMDTQRGFFYPFEDIFPGPICETFESLLKKLEDYEIGKDEKEKIDKFKKIFFEYLDSNNSQRVVDKVKGLLG